MTATYRFAVLTAVATFVLLVVGGTVNPTGSSLACPDWPTCYGSFTPEMTDGVEYEHTHRVVATLVGLLTCFLALMIWRMPESTAPLRRLGYVAAGLVIAQGLLGGMTVLLELPPLISMAHLALSMFFFSFMLYLAFRLWPGRTASADAAPDAAPRLWAGIAAVAVYVQILLGGAVRHSAAGSACGAELPWCGGLAWPATWPTQIHMIHRYGGLLVALIIVIAATNTAWHAIQSKRSAAFQLALLSPFLVILQVILGVLTVTSQIGVIEVTAHLALGALLLANWVLIYLAMGPQAKSCVSAQTNMSVVEAAA